MTGQAAADTPLLPKYMPELDGLRAIAILAVMLYHHNIPGFRLGWAGVQLFFVISGFLITGILLDSKTNPHYFRNFYARRFLRIFPIYYLALALVIGIALASEWGIGDTWYYLFYIQNHHLALSDWKVNFPPLLDHTWSLAIEEQFYILWPLIVYLLDVKKLKFVTVFLFVLALVTRAILLLSGSSANLQFMLLPTQVDALAAGSFLAIIARETSAHRKLSTWSIGLLVVSAVVLIALALSIYPHTDTSTASWADSRAGLILFSSMAVFFASLIAASVFSRPVLKSVLCLPWLRGIGKISYGLYLYHYPIYMLAAMNRNALYGEFGTQDYIFNIILTISLTFLIAGLSWKWFEAPILKYKDRYI